MNPIVQQTITYFVVLLIGFMMVAFLQKGFFLKYLKVRMSFGKSIMVKIRSLNRDYFQVGEVVEGFLIYKHGKDLKRVAIKDKDFSYRCLAIQFVDVDEEKNCIIKINFDTIEGYDAIKYSDLYKRALYKPTIQEIDKLQKIFIILIIVNIVIAIVSIVFIMRMQKNFAGLSGQISNVQSMLQTFMAPPAPSVIPT